MTAAKTLRELLTQRDDLASRVASYRRFGYHGSADVLQDRLDRTVKQIRRIEAHQQGALGRKVLVTPSNLSQFETEPPKALARNTVTHG